MTRNEKLEAMAREWCRINGWQADFQSQELTWEEMVSDLENAGNPKYKPTVRLGPPTWQLHVRAMDRLLKSIGE